jgi:opacity protein-like surface antigen
VKRTFGLSALVAGAMLSEGSLAAQSDNGGFMLNAHLTGQGLSGTGSESVTESGGGLGVALGYGFNDRIIVYFNLDAASMEYDEDEPEFEDESYDLVTGDLGVRVNFGNEGMRVRPYINAAFTGAAAVDEFELLDEDVESIVSGGGVTIGGGLQYFFSQNLALDVGVQATQGAFTEITVDDQDEEFEEGVAFTTSRIQLGVSWHP